MVNHIVMWSFREELEEKERVEAGVKIKELLEGLESQVEGVNSLKVIINEKGSSNKDVMLLSSFVSEEALEHYQQHPEHIKAGNYIRSVMYDRACMDYEE